MQNIQWNVELGNKQKQTVPPAPSLQSPVTPSAQMRSCTASRPEGQRSMYTKMGE